MKYFKVTLESGRHFVVKGETEAAAKNGAYLCLYNDFDLEGDKLVSMNPIQSSAVEEAVSTSYDGLVVSGFSN